MRWGPHGRPREDQPVTGPKLPGCVMSVCLNMAVLHGSASACQRPKGHDGRAL